MKKLRMILWIAIAATAFFSGCTNRYTEGVDIPRSFPKEMEEYDDAIAFEVVEYDDEITVYFGSEDDADDIGEFYKEEMDENLELILNELSEKRDEYTFEGIGSIYDFSIDVSEAEDRAARYYQTVIKIKIEYIDEKTELMEKLQGNWLYSGFEGNLLEDVKRHCMYYLIDDNSYGFYENAASELAETYVFFMDNNQIITRSKEGQTNPYDITFETIDDVDVMTMSSSQYAPQHFMKVSDDDLNIVEDINKTWQNMTGFWQYAGSDGALDDLHTGLAYDFDAYDFDVYADLNLTQENVLYHYPDANTIMYRQYEDMTQVDIKFETIDNMDVMTFVYDDGEMHFKQTTYEDYKVETGAYLGRDTLNNMQGLWYMVGINGEITDVQKDMGFAYEFRGNLFDTYNGFMMTNFDTEFRFLDANRFTYTTVSGYKVTAHVDFETIDNMEVMTYTVDSTGYHFIKVDYEEFLGYERPMGEDTLRKLQGFWQLAGVNGILSDDSRATGFAYEFTDNTFSTYNDFDLSTQNTELSFVSDNEITYLSSNGQTYTAHISFENIDGVEVMTYIISGTEYHFVKTTYDDYIKGAELSKLAIGFWLMVGQGGSLSDAVRAEGNAIEFTEDMMTTYVGYEISIQTDDYVIEEDTVIYDFGTGTLTAKIEFKTIDGVEVLSATILMQEYYFIRTTYEAFMANKS